MQFSLQWSRNFSVADCRDRATGKETREEIFNGAATFQLRIVAIRITAPRYYDVFNGAATFQLRIVGTCVFDVCLCRFFNGAATFQLRIGGCNNYRSWNITFFNGAATFQLRIGVGNVRTYKIFLSSMEPQLFSCGLLYPRWWFNADNNLQWSRNFSVADCCNCLRVMPRFSALQWSRNFSVADCWTISCRTLPNLPLQCSRNFSVADCRMIV